MQCLCDVRLNCTTHGAAQGGWLAHDFLHHQVFRHRSMNTVAGYIIGNIALVRWPASAPDMMVCTVCV